MVSLKEPIKHITGSIYHGFFNKALHEMEGIGSYTYPDGSTYRGAFKAGLFHGFGKLTLAAPYNVAIKGVFVEGQLESIDKIVFSDGLHMSVPFNGETLDIDAWAYCRDTDRRFCREHFFGLEAVGPTSMLTRNQKSREIPSNMYDNEEGIYRPLARVVTNMPKPFRQRRFVGCDEEHKWICDNCRLGLKEGQPLPLTHATCHQILTNNMHSSSKMDKHCLCDAIKSTYKDCQNIYEPANEEDSLDEDKSLVACSSSSSHSSLDIASLRESLRELFNCP